MASLCLMMIEATGAVVHEVERRLRVTEPVIKFLTVRTDEELKRLDKIKKIRDSKKKASAQPAGRRPSNSRDAGNAGSGAETPASAPVLDTGSVGYRFSGFVSGHRFSDNAEIAGTICPLGAAGQASRPR